MTSTEWTPTPGGMLHAAVVGPPGAPAVVGVPGLGCSHRYFLPLARELAPDARTAVLDLPGFGLSPGPRRALDVPGLAGALAAWLLGCSPPTGTGWPTAATIIRPYLPRGK